MISIHRIRYQSIELNIPSETAVNLNMLVPRAKPFLDHVLIPCGLPAPWLRPWSWPFCCWAGNRTATAMQRSCPSSFIRPLEVFASSPSSGALERLSAVDRINKLVLSYEARRLPGGSWVHDWFLVGAPFGSFCGRGSNQHLMIWNSIQLVDVIKSVSCRSFCIEPRILEHMAELRQPLWYQLYLACRQALDTFTNFSTMIPRLQEVAKLEDDGGSLR